MSGFGDLQIVLQNDVVTLRPIELEDVQAVIKAANDEAIWTHMSVTLLSEQAVQTYVNNMLRDRALHKSYTFVIIDNATNTIVGNTTFLDIDPTHKRLEIGSTWYNPSVWRSAINTNSKYLLMQYAFETLRYNRVQIKTGHENIRSQRAIERLGAQKEGVLRNHMIKKDGTIRHTVMYSVTAEEWHTTIRVHFENNLLTK